MSLIKRKAFWPLPVLILFGLSQPGRDIDMGVASLIRFGKTATRRIVRRQAGKLAGAKIVNNCQQYKRIIT